MLFEGSMPSRVFDIALKHGDILFSSSTIAELKDVLSRNKFDPYISYEERQQFFAGFIINAVPVEINETISECRDPKDNMFLELAVAGNANFIITGDEHLLELDPFRNIRIITPDSFLKIPLIVKSS